MTVLGGGLRACSNLANDRVSIDRFDLPINRLNVCSSISARIGREKMENESPNLFDSEPVQVNLTTVAGDNPDDVLAEVIEGIHVALSDSVKNTDGDHHVRDDADQYRTDESDGDDERADRSTEQQNDGSAETKTKDVHKGLPPGRVKLIMKMDPDVNIVAADAVFLLTKATESFVGLLAQHCHKEMQLSNKKTLQKKHIDAVIEENVPFEFLEGALDW